MRYKKVNFKRKILLAPPKEKSKDLVTSINKCPTGF